MKLIQKTALVRSTRYQEFEKHLATAIDTLQFQDMLDVEVQYAPPSRGSSEYTALLIGRER